MKNNQKPYEITKKNTSNLKDISKTFQNKIKKKRT